MEKGPVTNLLQGFFFLYANERLMTCTKNAAYLLTGCTLLFSRGRRIRTLNKGFGDPRVTITPFPFGEQWYLITREIICQPSFREFIERHEWTSDCSAFAVTCGRGLHIPAYPQAQSARRPDVIPPLAPLLEVFLPRKLNNDKVFAKWQKARVQSTDIDTRTSASALLLSLNHLYSVL